MYESSRRLTVRCGCVPRTERRALVIDATDCPARGRLSNPDCCAAVVAASTAHITSIRTRLDAGVHAYPDRLVGVLVAAGRFAVAVEEYDTALARRARRDPVGAAREAVGRGGVAGRLAAGTGLAEGVLGVGGDELNPLMPGGSSPCMLHDIDGAGDLAPGDLRAAYDDRLREVLDERGVDRVADETGLDADRLAALAGGESPSFTLDDAAAVLGASESYPDADAIVAETRDALLLGMTTAVLDVEAVESGLDGALDAREIQQKIEGRLSMSLDELAAIHGYIEAEKP